MTRTRDPSADRRLICRRLAYRAAQALRISWYSGQKMLAGRLAPPPAVPPALRGRLPDRARILDGLNRLIGQDWANIAAGHYAAPELLDVHPLRHLALGRRYFADLPAVEARRRTAAHDEVYRATASGRYPRYYLQNFHYQTDGYLSRRSAELYDHQVEVLFGGAAATMRRQALVPLHRLLAERRLRQARLIDLGCGTGGFLREVKRNYPRLRVTGLDLSPYYLAAARQALAPWSWVELIEASAEAVPAPAGGFDAVTAVYLLHELPPAARLSVVAEAARLLRPGGAAVLVDSLQLGDTPELDALLEYFPVAFHEPYYAHYIRDDLPARFAAQGLVLEESVLAYLSKIMVFRKPAE